MGCSGTAVVRLPGPIAPHRHLEDPFPEVGSAGARSSASTRPTASCCSPRLCPPSARGTGRFPALFLQEDRSFPSGDRGPVSFSVFVLSVTPAADSAVKVFRKTPPRTLPRAARDRTRAPFPPAVPVGAARTPPPPRRRPSVSPDTRNPFSQCSGLLATAPRRRIRRSCQLVVTTFRQEREGKTGTGPPGKDLTEPTGRPQSTSVSSDTLWPCRRRTRVTAGLRHNDGTGNTK